MDQNRTTGDFNAQELKQSLTRVRDDVAEVAGQIQSGYRQLDAKLKHYAAEKPLVVLGAAFGAGFVLGGGVFSRLFTAALVAGVRATLAQSLPSIPELLAGQGREPGVEDAVAPRDRTGAYGA
jgi:hypothetical protein